MRRQPEQLIMREDEQAELSLRRSQIQPDDLHPHNSLGVEKKNKMMQHIDQVGNYQYQGNYDFSNKCHDIELTFNYDPKHG